MCRENSFQSIKFSYDMVCPTELQINVYTVSYTHLDSVHKTSILERLKEQKQQEQTGEIQQKPKKKHEQEL